MPSVNPPVDAGQADAAPQVVLGNGGAEARIGRRGEADTAPPCAWRYVVLRTGDGAVYAGYLWER